MKAKRMELWQYCLLNGVGLLGAMLLYRILLFAPLDSMSYTGSVIYLWIQSVLMVLTGMFLTYERHRTFLCVACNVLAPFQFYTLVAYASSLGAFARVVVAVAGVLAAVYMGLVLLRRRRVPVQYKRLILRRRLDTALYGARTVAVVCLTALIIGAAVKPPALGNEKPAEGVLCEEVTVNVSEDRERWRFANNVETVKKIDPKIWQTLEIKERIEVLSTIKNIECRFFGIIDTPKLYFEPMEPPLEGYHHYGENRIALSRELLEGSDVERLLHCLFHEMHHVYARQQVELLNSVNEKYADMPMFYSVKKYREEYADYVSGTEQPLAYMLQELEQDAEDYAEDALDDYYEMIDPDYTLEGETV